MATLLGVIAVLAAYLIGSIPFGLMIARAVAGIDIRAIGSGNTGATNVGRILGMRWFAVVFALDFAKGCLPTLGVPRLLHALGYPSPPWLPVLVGLAAILGHNFPVYLRFKGGKGVATSLGTVMALEPVSAIASAFGFLIFLLEHSLNGKKASVPSGNRTNAPLCTIRLTVHLILAPCL